ncbi:MAG: hypothetical protein HY854_18190 [Burkholderiales bacterium]|nr:hypothetical protein [Burkholderiales bacterium]
MRTTRNAQSTTASASPFDWRRAKEDGQAARPVEHRMSVRERTEKVLMHRWGNPYCKPGWP